MHGDGQCVRRVVLGVAHLDLGGGDLVDGGDVGGLHPHLLALGQRDDPGERQVRVPGVEDELGEDGAGLDELAALGLGGAGDELRPPCLDDLRLRAHPRHHHARGDGGGGGGPQEELGRDVAVVGERGRPGRHRQPEGQQRTHAGGQGLVGGNAAARGGEPAGDQGPQRRDGGVQGPCPQPGRRCGDGGPGADTEGRHRESGGRVLDELCSGRPHDPLLGTGC